MTRTLIDELRETLLREIPSVNDIIVEEACLGLGYTGVKLQGGQAGICHSLQSETSIECCQILESAGTLAGRPATEFLNRANSWDMAERVLGIATINALSKIVFDAHPEKHIIERENLIDVIEVRPEDVVVLVGLITPFVPVFKEKAKKLYILERGSRKEEGVLPDTACEEVIPEADVAVITGSSLVNGTVDRLLELASGARVVAVVGPTVSCVPDPLFRRGADYVGGMTIRDADKALQIIAEGGGTPQLRRAGEFITFKAK